MAKFSNLEKSAAVLDLCENGFDFNQAVHLVKEAEILSDENKSAIKTFAASTAASIPGKLAGAAVGGFLGSKYLKGINVRAPGLVRRFAPSMANAAGRIQISGTALGTGIGAELASGAAELAAIKHSLPKNKERQNG